jgi:hypothetical protein
VRQQAQICREVNLCKAVFEAVTLQLKSFEGGGASSSLLFFPKLQRLLEKLADNTLQGKSLLEKLRHATSRPNVSATHPAVQDKIRLSQHRQNRVVRRPSVFFGFTAVAKSIL